MKPILMQWGKKPNGKEKHAPLLFFDSETHEPVKHGKPLSAADFEGSAIYNLVNTNNFFVEIARKWNVELGAAYGQFLEVGLRLA
ncbi:hypothetical protein HYU12_03705 [Candidatus Woesearchaeota archaeon]|nr:hypothetical protein [Candidatus Woesearchaeota archaeon]